MKLKCKNEMCAAGCIIMMEEPLVVRDVDSTISCISKKDYYMGWEMMECPECSAKLDDHGRCKSNCHKSGE